MAPHFEDATSCYVYVVGTTRRLPKIKLKAGVVNVEIE